MLRRSPYNFRAVSVSLSLVSGAIFLVATSSMVSGSVTNYGHQSAELVKKCWNFRLTVKFKFMFSEHCCVSVQTQRFFSLFGMVFEFIH